MEGQSETLEEALPFRPLAVEGILYQVALLQVCPARPLPPGRQGGDSSFPGEGGWEGGIRCLHSRLLALGHQNA